MPLSENIYFIGLHWLVQLSLTDPLGTVAIRYLIDRWIVATCA